MKKITAIITLVLMSVLLASCGNGSDGPLTEDQQAEKYGLSVQEFKEQKDAAARMNMTIEQHLNMSDSDSMGDSMDMNDDSSMIEDDAEETMIMPEWAHKMPDGSIMLADGTTMSGNHTMGDGTTMSNDEAMSGDSTHTMEDDTTMTDSEMHMEMMHEGDDMEEHGSDKHGDHE